MTEEEKAARLKPFETAQALLVAQAHASATFLCEVKPDPRLLSTLLLGSAVLAAARDHDAITSLIKGMKAYLADHGEISPPGEALQ